MDDSFRNTEDNSKNNNKSSDVVKVIISIVISKIFGIVFILLLITFILPILGGVFNIGNILGIIFCVVMLIRTWGDALFYLLRENKWGRRIMNVINVIFILGVAYVAVLTGLIIHADHTAPKQDCTVIVLGCQVIGDTPSLMLSERVDAAYEFLIENPDVPCIVSGGKGDGENLSEAQCMYNLLIGKGIDPDRIYMEDKSVNTKENIKFSKEIIEENNLSENTAIVTDIFHQYRASDIVKSNGLNYGSVPADCVWYLIPTYYVRELVAITATFVGLA